MPTFKHVLPWVLKNAPFGHQLRPAWLDEARLIIQGAELERLTAALPLRGRLLNAGCGEGLYSSFLESFREVNQIVNMDITRPSIASHRRDPRHCDQQGTLTDLPFDSAAFDVCLCTEVLEHIPDDRKAIAELARCLKPGGWLLLSVPTPPAPFDPNHIREGYTLAELKTLLAGYSFEVLTHAHCFYVFSRVLYAIWQRQYNLIGRNVFPRAGLRLMAHLDRRLKLGPPWDLLVLARRGP